jgi:RNA polymerase sigma factor (sigma-70 family)
VSGQAERKKRHSYRPTVEALEALRLLSLGGTAQAFPGLAVQRDVLPEPTTLAAESTAPSSATWDAALGQTQLADLLGPASTSVDTAAVSSGLNQLNRYLNRAWYRAGIPVQQHDDATQAVYVALLQNLGTDRFEAMLTDIGNTGIRDVLSRETADGPDFFRAVDTVKKRVQREKSYQPLDTIDVAASSTTDDPLSDQRGALREAIAQTLSPREAALIHDTLMGKTPAEIAAQWGVAPKTVSNEKTRVIQKLREVLVADNAA